MPRAYGWQERPLVVTPVSIFQASGTLIPPTDGRVDALARDDCHLLRTPPGGKARQTPAE